MRVPFQLPAVRVALGFMRQSTDLVRDEARARAVVHAALDEGLRLFDTAHAYGQGEHEYGHNERWLGRFLAEHARGGEARVVTKGGMRRVGPRYVPDGKASTLRAQCEASREALGRPIDLYLLHAVDPKTSLATSVRALVALRDEGLVRDIGLSNVTRPQLDEALSLTELGGVQLGVSLLDDTALRGGVVLRALELGVPVLCHSPLGGPKKYAQLAQQAWLVERAAAVGCSVHEWALASLLSLHEKVVVVPGARRVETVRSSRRAADVSVQRHPSPQPSPPTGERELSSAGVWLLMGLQGAGKTTAVSALVKDGWQRLNRDTEGGTLEQLHRKLDAMLRGGVSRVVLDNTYVTRAQRASALTVARNHGVAVHGVWHELSMEDAQLNVVTRMLDVHGRLLTPLELKRGKTPDSLSPRGLFTTARALEPVGDDEGFASLERRPFVRRPWPGGRPALFLGLELLRPDGTWAPDAQAVIDAHPDAVRVLLGWREGGVVAPAGVENAVCPHAGGPAECWCRPPLPGLLLERARTLGLGLAESRVLTASKVLASLAGAAGVPLTQLVINGPTDP